MGLVREGCGGIEKMSIVRFLGGARSKSKDIFVAAHFVRRGQVSAVVTEHA